eukprot:RCo011974
MAVNPTVAALRKASLPAALLRAGSASADQLLCGSEQLSPSSLSPVDKREGEGGGGEGTPRAGRFEGGAEVPPEQPLQGVLPDVLPPEDLPELLRSLGLVFSEKEIFDALDAVQCDLGGGMESGLLSAAEIQAVVSRLRSGRSTLLAVPEGIPGEERAAGAAPQQISDIVGACAKLKR